MTGKIFISDAHVDLPYILRQRDFTGPWRELTECDFTIDEAEKANVVFFVSALYLEDRYNGKLSLAHFYHALDYIGPLKEDVSIVDDFRQLERLEGPMKTILSVENADFIADDISLTGALKEKGILMVGLTHMDSNRLADGNGVRFGDGITKEGKAVLKRMEKEGLILDLSHLNERCFYQALDLFRGHLMVSHTGIREIFDIPRNISLAQAREVMERQGIVCVAMNPELMWDKFVLSIERVYASLDTIVEAFGPDQVAFGSDVCGFSTKGFSYSNAVGELIDLLWAKGYGDAIEKIMGLNLIGFVRKALDLTNENG